MINEIEVPYQLTESCILIDTELDFGLYMLRIKLLSEGRIRFNNITVNGVGIRQFLYLSWLDTNGIKSQPATEIWNTNQIWYAPFSNPMSLLISTASEKFESAELGTNLYEKYNIYYPEAVNVDASFPQLIKDFFKNNFDFHVYPKLLDIDPFHKHSIPFFNFNFQYNFNNLYTELTNQKEYLLSQQVIPAQRKYNSLDVRDNPDTNWCTVFTYPYLNKAQSVTDFVLDKDQLPELYKFYCSLPIKNIYGSFLGLLPPGGYLSPHKDPIDNRTPGGCSQWYFSVNAQEGNFLKIHKVGLLPFINNPVVFNNQDFTHAAVNQSNEPRWVVSIFANLEENINA
jgi:hypothetical protein